jgi:ABC-2 type transport system ATP-binding protein
VIPGWREWERAGALTRFIETNYAGETTERIWRERFGEAVVDAQPMTLREIFMVLARANRAEVTEAHA